MTKETKKDDEVTLGRGEGISALVVDSAAFEERTAATVFNANNTGYLTKKYPLFLGEPLGLYDSINVAYPKLMEHYRTQFSLNWNDEEINLENSRMDLMPHRSKPEEIDLMVKTLANLWELDSVASRSIIGLFGKFISNSELSALMTEWSRFEVIHALTYSQIIRNCIADPIKAVEEVVKNENVLGRSDLIVESLDDLADAGDKYGLGLIHDGPELKKIILKGLVAVYLLERVQFMSSFAVIFGMAETNRYGGIAKLVQLIARDELCMTGDHEVLTPQGWVRLDEIEDDVQVMQWDYETTDMNFTKTEKVIRKKYTGKLHRITSGNNRTVDQLVTADHRIPVKSPFTDKPKREWYPASDYVPSHTRSIPINGYVVEDGHVDITPMEKLAIAFQADGTTNDDPIRNGKFTGEKMLTFSFRRERKIDCFYDLLEETGLRHTVNKTENDPQTRFHVWVPADLDISNWKNFGWIDYTKVTHLWAEQFIQEILVWDGHIRYKGHGVYINSNRDAVDVVQTLAHLSGYQTTIVTTEPHVRESNGTVINAGYCYRLSIIESRGVANGQVIKNYASDVEDIDVYCLRVPTGYFLVRRNGVISITGNCHARFAVDIINILREDKDWDQVYTENMNEFEAMVDEIINREFRWNEYLFSEGRQMVGLNANLLNEFTLYSAKDVTGFLGLRLNHPKISKLPLTFFDNWVHMDKVQPAPQEESLNNYRAGNVMDDATDEIFDI